MGGGTATINLKLKVSGKNRGGPHRKGDGYENYGNFNEINLEDDIAYYQMMFYNIPENPVICINESITKYKIFPQIKNKTCFVIDCSDNWKLNRKKIINSTDECIESCSKTIQYIYEYDGKCYENCINNYYIDDKNNYYCTIDSSCPNEYPKLIENNKKCIKFDIQNIINDILINERNETENRNNIL